MITWLEARIIFWRKQVKGRKWTGIWESIKMKEWSLKHILWFVKNLKGHVVGDKASNDPKGYRIWSTEVFFTASCFMTVWTKKALLLLLIEIIHTLHTAHCKLHAARCTLYTVHHTYVMCINFIFHYKLPMTSLLGTIFKPIKFNMSSHFWGH